MQIDSLSTNEELGKRDAFHCPAVLVRSDDRLKGGDSVRFTNNDFTDVVKSTEGMRHAVISPFVSVVKPHEKVWALLIPNVTSNLHHKFDILIYDVEKGPKTLEAEQEAENLDEYMNDSCRGCW